MPAQRACADYVLSAGDPVKFDPDPGRDQNVLTFRSLLVRVALHRGRATHMAYVVDEPGSGQAAAVFARLLAASQHHLDAFTNAASTGTAAAVTGAGAGLGGGGRGMGEGTGMGDGHRIGRSGR